MHYVDEGPRGAPPVLMLHGTAGSARNLLTPTSWLGEEANKYLDGLTGKYESALTGLGAIKK